MFNAPLVTPESEVTAAVALHYVPFQSFANESTYEYADSGALARQQWSNKVHMEVQKQTFFVRHGFIGSDEGNEDSPFETKANFPLVTRDEIGKGKGATVTIPMALQLTNAGGNGNEALIGSSPTKIEKIEWAYATCKLEQKRFAVQYDGPMSEIRNPAHGKELCTHLLTNRFVKWYERDIFYTFLNGSSQHLVARGLTSAVAHPNQYYGINKASINNMVDSDVPCLAWLNFIKLFIRLKHINPIKMPDSSTGHVLVMHDLQMEKMFEDQAYVRALENARPREKTGNPLWDDADHVYRGIHFYATDQVLQPNDSPHGQVAGWEDMYGAILLGGNAMGLASGGIGTRGLDKVRYGIVPSYENDFDNDVKYALRTVCGNALATYTRETAGTLLNQSSGLFWTKANSNPFAS